MCVCVCCVCVCMLSAESESECEDNPLSCTPPQFLKAKNMYTYSRINKYTGEVFVFKELKEKNLTFYKMVFISTYTTVCIHL